MRPSPVRLLVIDDDPHIISVFRRISKELPLQVRFAVSAEEGMVLIDAELPSIVICDYRLPGMDGLTLLERLHERFPEVKRILHTGEAVLRTSFGVDVPVLAKPCPADSLRELLESISRGEM